MNKRLIVALLALSLVGVACPPIKTQESKKSTLTFYFTDYCDDREATRVTLYDVTDGFETWGPYSLRPYNEELEFKIECERGHRICYGAETSGGHWGCGPGCSVACANCCARCDGQIYEPVTLACRGGGDPSAPARGPSAE